MLIIENIDKEIAKELCREIIINECNENYLNVVFYRKNFVARIYSKYIGLISIDFPYLENANIYFIDIYI